MNKRFISALLSASLLIQIPLTAAAAELKPTTDQKDDTFYYVAVGDSVAAGFGIEDTSEPQKGMTSMYLDRNYKNSPVEAYPNVVASALKDTLVSQGAITEEQFDYSNMGACSFMMKDFYGVLTNPDHIAALYYNMFVQRYEEERLAYEAAEDKDAFRADWEASTTESISTTVSGYIKDYYVPTTGGYGTRTGQQRLSSYSRYGGTITAGSEPWLDSTWYTAPAEDAAEDVIKQAQQEALAAWYADENGFGTWYEPWFTGWINNYLDENYDSYIDRIEGTSYKYYDLFRSEIAKADMMTVDIGANDLLEQLMFTLNDMGLGTDYEVDSEASTGGFGGTTYYKNVANPLIFMTWQVLYNLMSGGTMDAAITTLEDLITYYQEDITTENIIEYLQLMSSDTISQMLLTNSEEAMALYPDVIDEMKEINSDAQLAFVGAFNPFGTSIECDGVEYTFAHVATSIITRIFNEVINQPSDDETPSDDASLMSEDIQNSLSVDAQALSDSDAAVAKHIANYDRNLSKLENITENSDVSVFADEAESNPTVDAIIGILTDELQYLMIYNMLGKPAVEAVDYMNAETEKYAEQYGAPYIDILSTTPNENNLNPHPLTEGHKAMADTIDATLIQDITYTSTEGGTVSGPTSSIYGYTVDFDIMPDDGYVANNITVNGEVFSNPSFVTTQDSEVSVVFEEASAPSTYTVTVSASEGGTVTPDTATYTEGEDVTFTITPDEGYSIESVIVDGEDMGAVSEYTIPSISKDSTIEVVFVADEEPVVALPFTDVTEDDWFYSDVEYVYENGLMTGTDVTTFEPSLNTKRGMIVTVLHRLEGEPEATVENTFTDVDADAYYADAVAWAAENGIVNGYDAETFAPEDIITREQLATIMYRYAEYKGYDISAGEDTNIESYDDAASISDYAINAMQWMCGTGLMNGSDNNLEPQGNATRAQVAAILHRYCENIAE